MRYKIVKMTKEEVNNFHSCDLCECAHESCMQNGVKLYNGFCDYPGECPAGENEFIKKVYK